MMRIPSEKIEDYIAYSPKEKSKVKAIQFINDYSIS